MSKGPWISVLSGFFVTAVLVAGSMYLRAEDASFRSAAAHGEANVVGPADVTRRDQDGNLETHKFDRYEFKTAAGQIIRFTSPVTVMQPRREVGARAAVLYPPNDPSDARLDDANNSEAARWMLWSSPIGLLFSALFLTIWRRSQRTAVLS